MLISVITGAWVYNTAEIWPHKHTHKCKVISLLVCPFQAVTTCKPEHSFLPLTLLSFWRNTPLCLSPHAWCPLSECRGNLELVFLLTSEKDTPSGLRISVAEVLRDARPIHLGHKCLFPVAPEQQPDHVMYFVHLNNEGMYVTSRWELCELSIVPLLLSFCCEQLCPQMKGYLGMQKVWSWTEMHLQLADVSKNSTLVINHKDYEIIFCLCVFNQS